MGYRMYSEDYFDYCRAVSLAYRPTQRKDRLRAFVGAALFESQLDIDWQLPHEHFLGLCEAYTDITYAQCVAKHEHDRLYRFWAQAAEDRDDKLDPIKQDHCVLILTTSISYSGQVDTDISRTIIHEIRDQCNCLLCVPAIETAELDILSKADGQRVASLLHQSPLALSAYLPFRRRHFRAPRTEARSSEGTLV